MSVSALLPLAMQLGLPIVVRVLSGRIGSVNGQLVGTVLDAIATRVGTTVDKLDEVAETMPAEVGAAMREVEGIAPEMVEVYDRGLQGQFALLMAEREDPVWMRAWRPLGMYVIGFLWLWAIVLLHGLNAIFKIALPPVDLGILFQLSALYLGLYMGGHTVKDFVARKWGVKEVLK